MYDSLTIDQRQRLAVLYATWNALHAGELGVWDLIDPAHWVCSKSEDAAKACSPDAATWRGESA